MMSSISFGNKIVNTEKIIMARLGGHTGSSDVRGSGC